jgi:hypothetical protein
MLYITVYGRHSVAFLAAGQDVYDFMMAHDTLYI